VLDLLADGAELRGRLRENTAWFRARMTALGFDILPGDHPIVPVMIGDAALATRMADLLLAKGVYVIGFSYPVVPAGQARIRTQLSAAHTRADLEFAADAFAAARAELLSHNDLAFIAPATAARPRCPVVWSTLVTSVSVKPRLAGRQPSSRGGVLRVRTWRLLIRQRQARVPQG
jgi:hypothetical protein